MEKLKTCDVWATAVNGGRLSNPDALGPSKVAYELWLEAHRPLFEGKSPKIIIRFVASIDVGVQEKKRFHIRFTQNKL